MSRGGPIHPTPFVFISTTPPDTQFVILPAVVVIAQQLLRFAKPILVPPVRDSMLVSLG